MTDTLPPFTSAELADLKAKAEGATQGEWEAVTRDDPRGQPMPYYQSLICTVEHSPDRHLSVVAKNGSRISREEWEANCEHIASANPQTILRLIDMIERRYEQIEKLRVAASKLTLRLREIENDKSYQGIWPYLYAHNYTYSGPRWEAPLKELEDLVCQPSEALAATEPPK